MINKFLFPPLEFWLVGQRFGENGACIKESGTGAVISCNGNNPPTGYRSVYGEGGHNGWDCFAVNGQKLFASSEGFVEEHVKEDARGLGLGIITSKKEFCIETGKEEHFKIRYWHLKDFNCKLGDKVEVGDLIGYCNNTGYSAGDHLHYEIKPVAKNSKDNWYNILQDNKTFGAVDPTPYFDSSMSAVEFRKRLNIFKQAESLSKIPGMGPTVIKILQTLLSFFR